MNESILDVRAYKLKPGAADAFAARFDDEIEPMLQRHGIKVIHFGRSLIDPDSFCLIRSFPSLEEREAKLTGFYGSEEWLELHDEAVVSMIDHHNVCVIRDELTQQGFDRVP